MEMMAGDNIDYSQSRRKSTMIAKKIQKREDRLSQMGRKTDNRKQSAMVSNPKGRLVSIIQHVLILFL